jgi:hypothetical protein
MSKFATVDGHELLGFLDDVPCIDLNPARTIKLSYAKFDFNLDKSIVETSGAADFIGISIMDHKANNYSALIRQKTQNRFTFEW